MSNKKLLKVLCLGRFCDDEPGGTQTHVETLFQALNTKVDFVNLVPARTAKSDVVECAGVKTYRMAGFRLESSVYLSPLMVWKLWRLNRKHRFDVVHLHFPDPMSHLASMLLPRRVARVITWHSDILRQKTLLSLYRPFLVAAVRRAQAVIVPTPAHVSSSEVLASLKDELRLHIVPFGFDFSALLSSKNPHPAKPQGDRRFTIFALGRHVYYKGFDVLIRAVAQMDRQVRLVLGGDGPLSPYLKNLSVELAVEDKVHFTGRIADEELGGYYASCDVFCLPAVARTEAFGIVQVEAMAFGKAVVSTRLENGVDYVNRHEDTGLLAEPGNLESLIQCLERLQFDEELRHRLGERGRQKALVEYSLSNMGKLTLEAYEIAVGLA
ncbi:MAG: glycosyltransferase [Limnobacter sp.]|nr:glycosyltransferase [Limnobacter sp.]